MFIHNFKYSLLLLLKNKQLIFWTLAFPLIMCVLFNMAFSDIAEKTGKSDPVDIAVINDDDFKSNSIYKDTLKTLGEGDDRVFNIKYVSSDKAKKLLEDDEIAGYLSVNGDDVKVTVNSTGIDETIFCYVIDEIKSDSSVIKNIGESKIEHELQNGNMNIDYEKIYNDVSKRVLESDVNIRDNSSDNLNDFVIEYYSLIAMACMYSGVLSLTLINYKLANITSVGKRTSISPAKKGGMLLGSLSAAFLVQLFGLLLLYLMMIFYVGVDFGNNLPMIILISILGSISGLTLGIAVAVFFKMGENAKTTALIGIVMAGCFLSGMMGITMKNIIDKSIPILNRINPVAMITDGLYALYYYDSMDRFIINAVSLIIFSAVMLIISWRGLRRQRYDSI